MITLNQHRASLTQALVAQFLDQAKVKTGFGAFFPAKTTQAKQISIEVERHGKPIAVDVQRCTDPIRNVFSKSTEKIFVPPYFHESFDFTLCQSYDVTFGRGVVPQGSFTQSIFQEANKELLAIQNKIKRAVLLQQAQVLINGIVTLKNGDNIDYKRKAGSMVTKSVAAEKWTAPTTSDPVKDLKAAGEFLRGTGNSGASELNAIMGSQAFENFMASSKVLALGDIRNVNRVAIDMPMMDNVSGLTLQAKVGAGDFIVYVWTYNETYENASGVETRYLDTNTVVVLPTDFVGNTVYAGLPAVMGDAISGQYIANVEAEFLVYDVIDQKKRAWEYIVDSAPLVVPVSVDRIYTLVTTS